MYYIAHFNYNDSSSSKEYIYQRNIQGDIIGIFDDKSNQVGGYIYDGYGNHIITLDVDGIASLNPFRYRGYFYDKETQLYYLNSRYYDSETGRFISPNTLSILDETRGQINGLNLYMYCMDNPIMYVDPSGNMPEWAQWVIGGPAIAGLVVATILTCGVAGAGAAAVGAAMLTGGLVSAGINVIDQLHDGGKFNWSELAISTLSGTAYGLVVGLSGGVAAGTWSWGAYAGKLAVAGGTSLLNSWNENKSFKDTMISFASSLVLSSIYQGLGYGFGKIISNIPKNPTKLMTLGDIGSYLWGIPAVKVGVIRFCWWSC